MNFLIFIVITIKRTGTLIFAEAVLLKNRFIAKYDIKLETVSIDQINNNFYLMLKLNERHLGISEIQ